jgi:hypothetical protein
MTTVLHPFLKQDCLKYSVKPPIVLTMCQSCAALDYTKREQQTPAPNSWSLNCETEELSRNYPGMRHVRRDVWRSVNRTGGQPK